MQEALDDAVDVDVNLLDFSPLFNTEALHKAMVTITYAFLNP